jgi:polyhydroxybutyrate depolymerase
MRVYELVVPPGYDPEVPTPLVMNWHGLGSNGPDQLGFSEYPALAAEKDFLVVAPTGVPSPGQTQNSWELTDDDDPTRDDIAFAEAVLDRVIATTCVDDSRVYTTGMSNGGYFSSRLVCELADRIAAAASVAALGHPDDCEPSRPVPYIGFHGVDDEIVPYDGGGYSSLFPGVQIELFEAVIPDEFAEFADTFGCEPSPIEESISADVTAFEYQNCPGGIEAVFYELDNAGHTWPGSSISLAIGQVSGLGVTNTDISATELSWELFSRHSLD